MSGVIEALLLLLLVAIVLLALFRRRAARIAEPSCGGCGYPIVGLPTTICPECGSDLLLVGVRWPGERRRWIGPLMIIGWLVIFPFLAAPLHVVMMSVAPREFYQKAEVALVPVSKSFVGVELTFEHEGLGSPPTWSVPLRSITVTKWTEGPPPESEMIRIEPDLSAYSSIKDDEATVEARQPLTATGFAQWLARDVPAHPELEDDSLELWRLIGSYQNGEVPSTGRFKEVFQSSAQNSNDLPWIEGSLFLFWLGIYVGGAILIGRRLATRR